MTEQDKNKLINRILSGKVFIDDYVIKPATPEIKYRADLYYEETYNEFKYDEIPLRERLFVYLVNFKFIEPDYNKKLDTMRTSIDNLKEWLYLAGPKINEEKELRKKLNMMKKMYNDYYNKVEGFAQYSLEEFCRYYKNIFILINTIYKNDKLVFSASDIDNFHFLEICSKIKENEISIEDFRELSRTDPWRTYWNLYKISIFESKNLSEDQKILSSFSRMYDNAFDSPECPEEQILNDDDKFDGWLIRQYKKYKESKTDNTQADVLNKMANYQEVYLPAANQEEANKIYASNSADSKKILTQRAKMLGMKNVLKESELPDKRLELQQKATRAFIQHAKGKQYG